MAAIKPGTLECNDFSYFRSQCLKKLFEPVYEMWYLSRMREAKAQTSLHCPAQCREIAPLDSCACMLKECIHKKYHDLIDMHARILKLEF